MYFKLFLIKLINKLFLYFLINLKIKINSKMPPKPWEKKGSKYYKNKINLLYYLK